MKKILFLIPNLSVGGAEKVLVNLVNNMDKSEFDITVQVLFAGGVNEKFLKEHITLKRCFKRIFRGNIHFFKLFSPEFLYKWFIKEHYDIVVSYLEGPTARIVSGCPDKDTKLVSWIHCRMDTEKKAMCAFRSFDEAKLCYEKFHNTICVSKDVMLEFVKTMKFSKKIEVLYNTNESNKIICMSNEKLDIDINDNETKMCVVGKLSKNKGSDRIIRIQKRLLTDGFNTHLYYLGTGSEQENIISYAKENGISDKVTLLGYQTNPYKYVKACDLFVCASLAEGFSTAATEALIVGTPVITVEVSGMKEMLGENNEYGIVTENSEEALYEGIKKMLSTAGMIQDYAKRAEERGKCFSTDNTVQAIEYMLYDLVSTE